MYQSLVKSPGWAVLVEEMEGMKEEYLHVIVKVPAASEAERLRVEFLKAEMGGWNRVLSLPQERVDTMEARLIELRAMREAEREAEEDENERE